jgi:hypothetical protein
MKQNQLYLIVGALVVAVIVLGEEGVSIERN